MSKDNTTPDASGNFETQKHYYIPFIPEEITTHPLWPELTWRERCVYLVMRLSDRPDNRFTPSRKWIGEVVCISDLNEVTKVIVSLVKKGWLQRRKTKSGYNTYAYAAPDLPVVQTALQGSQSGELPYSQSGEKTTCPVVQTALPNLNLKSLNKNNPPPPPTGGSERPSVKEGGGLLRNSEPERSRDIPTFPDEVYTLLISLNLRHLTERYLKIYPDKMTVEYLSKLLTYIQSQSDIKSKRKFAIAAIERGTWSPEDDMSRKEPTKATILITAPCKKCRKHYEVTEQQARDYECPICFYAPIEHAPEMIESVGTIFDQFRRKRGIVRREPKAELPPGSPRGAEPGDVNTCAFCHGPYTIDAGLDFLCPPCRSDSQRKNSLATVDKTIDDHNPVY